MPKLGLDDTVFIYLHGNGNNRGAPHRLAAYKVFQSQGYHTLTLDYRGYGDSVLKGEIGEDILIQDAKAAIEFVRREVGDKAKLILYGHSLGTGIASRVAAEVTGGKNGRVDGIILDSPFHSFKNILEKFPYKILSYLMIDFDTLLEKAGAEFNSPKWLSTIKIPVTIFHAEADKICTIEMAEELVEDVKKMGKENIDMIRWSDKDISAEDHLGHNGITKAETFPKYVRQFVESVHFHYQLESVNNKISKNK